MHPEKALTGAATSLKEIGWDAAIKEMAHPLYCITELSETSLQ
jgi:hypothetical protein